jgi:magnesium transporter
VALVFQDIRLGMVIGAAMIINLAVAGIAGTLVPLGMKRAGVDPALASSVFVTMVTDSMGFLAFLGLATAVGFAG